jgi:hypothetical protein
VTAFYRLLETNDDASARRHLRAAAAQIAAGVLAGTTHDDAAILRVAEWILDEHAVSVTLAEAPEGLTAGDVLDEILFACQRHGIEFPYVELDQRSSGARGFEVRAYPRPTAPVVRQLLAELGAEEVRAESWAHVPDGALAAEIETLGATVRMPVEPAAEPEPAPVEPASPTVAEPCAVCRRSVAACIEAAEACAPVVLGETEFTVYEDAAGGEA